MKKFVRFVGVVLVAISIIGWFAVNEYRSIQAERAVAQAEEDKMWEDLLQELDLNLEKSKKEERERREQGRRRVVIDRWTPTALAPTGTIIRLTSDGPNIVAAVNSEIHHGWGETAREYKFTMLPGWQVIGINSGDAEVCGLPAEPTGCVTVEVRR